MAIHLYRVMPLVMLPRPPGHYQNSSADTSMPQGGLSVPLNALVQARVDSHPHCTSMLIVPWPNLFQWLSPAVAFFSSWGSQLVAVVSHRGTQLFPCLRSLYEQQTLACWVHFMPLREQAGRLPPTHICRGTAP